MIEDIRIGDINGNAIPMQLVRALHHMIQQIAGVKTVECVLNETDPNQMVVCLVPVVHFLGDFQYPASKLRRDFRLSVEHSGNLRL